MLVENILKKVNFKFIIGVLYVWTSAYGCIQSKTPDPSSLILNLVGTRAPEILQSPVLNGCIVSTDLGNERISMCFQIEKSSCSLGFFNNLTTEAILQKRKNDLTFININYNNCSASATSLFSKYNVASVPSSMIFKDLISKDGPNLNSDFTITSVRSCEESGFLENRFVHSNFESLLNENELKSLDSVEVELALIATTTEACIDDLNFQEDFLVTLDKFKNHRKAIGIVCSYSQISSYEQCPN